MLGKERQEQRSGIWNGMGGWRDVMQLLGALHDVAWVDTFIRGSLVREHVSG